jgi:hypothetical protein
MMRKRNYSAGIAGMVFLLALLLASCPMGGGGSGGSSGYTPVLPGDNPAAGEMSAATAEALLTYSDFEDGVLITGFLDLAVLETYLNSTPASWRAASGTESSVWRIKAIDAKPVLGITDGAFANEKNLGQVVHTIELPETIKTLGESLFAGTTALTLNIPNTTPLGREDFEKAATGNNITIQIFNPANPAESQIVVRGPPVLLRRPLVDYTQGRPRISYTFNRPVTGSVSDSGRWSVTPSSPAETVTVQYIGTDYDPVDLALSAEEVFNGVSRTTEPAPVEVLPVTEVFQRPPSARTYTLVYYDKPLSIVRLVDSPTVDPATAPWYYVPDSNLRDLFDAVYSPNAPGSTDTVETPKQALAYDNTISRAVLKLFAVTLGRNSSSDKVEIKGADLPSATGAGKYKPIVIDIGIPGKNNDGLPSFSLDRDNLGTAPDDYAHIHLRVNQGAQLSISGGTSYGNLKNATLEVIGGGRLVDADYEGFLGAGAIVIVRLNAYLKAGPNSSFEYGDYDDWLIGPTSADGVIHWGTGDQNGSYIELWDDVEDGDLRLALSADIALLKTLVLDYQVWFVGGPILRVDAARDSFDIGGNKGLFAKTGSSSPTPRFYGNFFESGGENPARVEAMIILHTDSTISRSLLTNSAGGDIQGPTSGWSYIPNKGSGGAEEHKRYRTDTVIQGYLNWNIP